MDSVAITKTSRTALSIANSAWSIATALNAVAQNTADFDSTILFASEIKAWGSACESLGDYLQSLVKNSDQTQGKAGPPPGELWETWTYLEDQLLECQVTILALQEAVQLPDSTSAGSVACFSLNAEDVSEATTRVQAHTNSLELIAHVVAVEVEIARWVPQRSNTLRSLLDDLIRQRDATRRFFVLASDEAAAAASVDLAMKVIRQAEAIRQHESQSDSEENNDDFTVEAARQSFKAGTRAFDQHDFPTASKIFEDTLKLLQDVPRSRQNLYDITKARYMSGVCAYHAYDPSQAEPILRNFLDDINHAAPDADERDRQIYHTGHLLAQVYVKLGKLEQARLCCHDALQGRRRLLGREHASTYESLALLSKILELEGNISRARIYFHMLPEHDREALFMRFVDLCPQQVATSNNIWTVSKVRGILPALQTCLVEIETILSRNIRLQQEVTGDIEIICQQKAALQESLYVTKVVYEVVPLEKPRVVCSHKDCGEFKDNQKFYSNPCLDPCYLENVAVDQFPCEALLNTEIFNYGESKSCRHCKHSWQLHLHIMWETRARTVRVREEGVDHRLRDMEENLKARQESLQHREESIRQREQRKRVVELATGRLSRFVEENSILPLDDSLRVAYDTGKQDPQARKALRPEDIEPLLTSLTADVDVGNTIQKAIDTLMKSKGD